MINGVGVDLEIGGIKAAMDVMEMGMEMEMGMGMGMGWKSNSTFTNALCLALQNRIVVLWYLLIPTLTISYNHKRCITAT